MKRAARRGAVALLVGTALYAIPLAPVATTAGDAQGDPAGVRVIDTRGQRAPCRAVDLRGARFIRGGCPAHAYEFTTRLMVRSVFGAMRFGDCTTNMDVTFARDGRFWLDNILIGGPAPCNDVWACSPPKVIAMRKRRTDAPPRSEVPPWRGRVLGPASRAGEFRGSFRFCVDTCVGRYAGDLDVTFAPDDGGWLMRAASAGVGSSGLEVEAEWDLDPADFSFEPAS